MRVKTILMVWLLLCGSTLFAQLQLGVQGGWHQSRLNVLSSRYEEPEYDPLNGWAAGGLVQLNLMRRLALYSNPMYVGKGREISFGDEWKNTLHLNYLEVPLMLKLYLLPSPIRLFISGGGYWSTLLNATEAYESSSESGENDVGDLYSTTDYGYAVGGGVEVPFRRFTLHLEGRYAQGLKDIHKCTESQIDLRTAGLSMFCGISIPLVPKQVVQAAIVKESFLVNKKLEGAESLSGQSLTCQTNKDCRKIRKIGIIVTLDDYGWERGDRDEKPNFKTVQEQENKLLECLGFDEIHIFHPDDFIIMWDPQGKPKFEMSMEDPGSKSMKPLKDLVERILEAQKDCCAEVTVFINSHGRDRQLYSNRNVPYKSKTTVDLSIDRPHDPDLIRYLDKMGVKRKNIKKNRATGKFDVTFEGFEENLQEFLRDRLGDASLIAKIASPPLSKKTIDVEGFINQTILAKMMAKLFKKHDKTCIPLTVILHACYSGKSFSHSDIHHLRDFHPRVNVIASSGNDQTTRGTSSGERCESFFLEALFRCLINYDPDFKQNRGFIKDKKIMKYTIKSLNKLPEAWDCIVRETQALDQLNDPKRSKDPQTPQKFPEGSWSE